jgi:uncharacterized membrane protein YccC
VARLSIHDPGFTSLRSAARAAVMVPAVFAVADRVIGLPALATFAAFGSFATLVLVEFTGPMRSRFIAYLVLACVGAADIVVGTLCSGNPWLAAGAMAAVGFTIIFSGLINGYFAAAGTAAMLPFVLAVMIPAPVSALGPRLEGWALAAATGIGAQMLLWPARPQASLRSDAARACRALAGLVASLVRRQPEAIEADLREADGAVSSLRRRFLSLPHRPAVATGRQAALNSLVEELDWLLSSLTPPPQRPGLQLCEQENAEALEAVAEALGASASCLDGDAERVDPARLQRTRAAVAEALAQRLPTLHVLPDHQELAAEVEPAFRVRVLSYGAEAVRGYARAASGRRSPAPEGDLGRWRSATRPLGSALRVAEHLTAEHATARSVWFRNSVRGAVGVALAVLVAQLLGLQHAFWVVLGTLSVLRSNALGTGWSIVSALGGTAIGILMGSALVIPLGTHAPVLWAALPVAVLLGSYAPRAISFAAGQAGFTVVLIVLFNLIQPVGWSVGIVRIEDVAIGFGISLGVGLLFWPRGVARLLRQNLASAFASGADYMVAAEQRLVGRTGAVSTDAAEHSAAAAEHRLDEAYRQYLSESSPVPQGSDRIAPLVAGAARLRRASQSLLALSSPASGADTVGRCGGNLDAEVGALHAWYVTLGRALVSGAVVPAPHTPDAAGHQRLLECVRDALATGDRAQLRPALDLLWASQHLDALGQLERDLARDATQATEAPARVATG